MDDLSPWNLKKLNPPPCITLEYTKVEHDRLFSGTNYELIYRDKLVEACGLFARTRGLFDEETRVLERLLHHERNALRKEKTWQHMKRVKSLLGKFNSLGVQSLSETVSSLGRSISLKSTVCLPSRELYEYYLVRLLSGHNLAQLMLQHIKSKLFIELVRNVKNGLFVSNNLLFMSNCSRIYYMVKKYDQYMVHIYNNLREYLHIFKSTGVKWFPDVEFNHSSLPAYLGDFKRSIDQGVNETNLQTELEPQPIDGDLQDFGDVIERVENIPPASLSTDISNHQRLKSTLYNKLNKLAVEFKNFVTFKKRLRKFLSKMIHKKPVKYVRFLRECVLKNKRQFKCDFSSSVNMSCDKRKKLKLAKIVFKICKISIKKYKNKNK